MKSIAQRIAEELSVAERQVAAAVELLDGGATVPFIARYRKEATGALDDTQLRTLEERLRYLRELEERRKAILDSIRDQGKLDAALEAQINDADTKARLEDIYLPYKPKRRTKAQIARENGLEPLAEALLAHPERDPKEQAAAFVKPDAVATAEDALDGARAILVERFAEDAELIGRLREDFWTRGKMAASVRDGKQAGRREVRRLFRLLRAADQAAVAPHSRADARRARGGSRSQAGRRSRRRSDGARRPVPTNSPSPIASRSPTAAGRATAGWSRPCAGRGAPRSKCSSASTCACGCGRRPRTKRCACSAPTCAICCSPRRPARGRRWGSIPAFAPA